MENQNRREPRYDNTGRVESAELCALPGVLDDISISGCRVHFPIPFSIDMENDYELMVKLSYKGTIHTFELLVHPRWLKTDDEKTTIGFSILRSPDSPKLATFITLLTEDAEDKNNVSNLIIDSTVHFIN
ncbi:MAG: PilZ domain-containing protein [Treponema sp.]|nr:PilZ domain-containing protein [Treponema sp.]